MLNFDQRSPFLRKSKKTKQNKTKQKKPKKKHVFLPLFVQNKLKIDINSKN